MKNLNLLILTITVSIFTAATPSFGQGRYPTRRAWTYIRIVDYNSLWGTQGPTLQEVLGHLPQTVPDGVNFVLLGEGYKSAGIYAYVTPNGERKIIFKPRLSMNATTTYTDFFNWVAENFPANHYVLSDWGHGAGAGYSKGTLGFDAVNDDNGLSLNEWGSVVSYLSGKLGQRLSVLFLCTCLNGTIENAYAIKDSADYYVAGESPVGCALEPYDELKKTRTFSSAQLANQTVEDFYGKQAGLKDDVVYSAIDLGQVRALADSIGRLGLHLSSYVGDDSSNAQQVLNIADKADNMDIMGQTTMFGTYLDLADFAFHLAAEVQDNDVARDALEIQQRVVKHAVTRLSNYEVKGNYSHSHGISIVHPKASFQSIDLDYYSEHFFSRKTGWADYLRLFSPSEKAQTVLPSLPGLFKMIR